MSETKTAPRRTDSTTEKPGREAAGAPNFAEMCQGLADMGSRMMAEGMPECCRPGKAAPTDVGHGEADETPST